MSRADNTIEAIEAFRPLEDAGFISGLEQAAPEIFGKDALDFKDGILRDHALILMEPGEIVFVAERTNGILDRRLSPPNKLPGPSAAGDSHSQPISARLSGELRVREVRQPDRSLKPVLMAPVVPDEPLNREKSGLMSGVRKKLPWASGTRGRIMVRLAALTAENYYMPGDPRLVRLATFLPSMVDVLPLKVEKTTMDIRSLARR